MKWERLNGDESGVLIADQRGVRWLLRSKRQIGRFIWEAVADHAVTGRLRVVDDGEYHTRREAEAAAEAAITGLGFRVLPWDFNQYLDFFVD